MALDTSDYNNQQMKLKPEIQTNKSLDSWGFLSIQFGMITIVSYRSVRVSS